MKTSFINRGPGVWILIGMLLMVVAWSGPAFAQTLPTMESILQATKDDDWSMKMWTSLFGEFARNPFSTLGGPTTLLGGVFVIFNTCIFVAGFTWALYGVVSAVAGTANEGEALGKRMNTVWFPIRMIIGIAGMVPIFGGFTLTQAIMMMLTTVGIGIGNTMWTGAVKNTSQMQGLMQNQSMSPAGASKMREAARSMFMSNVCVIAQGDHLESMGSLASRAEQMQVKSVSDGGTNSYHYGSLSDPTKCGFVTIEASVRSASNPMAFRSAAVDYSAIESAANNAYVAMVGTLQMDIAALATTWYNGRKAALANGGVVPPFPLAELEKAVDTFGVNSNQAISNSAAVQDKAAIHKSAEENMLKVGWIGAGAWFSTFAEVNAGIADAAKGPTVKAKPTGGLFSSVSSLASESMDAAQNAYGVAHSAKGGSAAADPSKAILDSALRDSGCGTFGAVGTTLAGTTTGECSVGQAIVSAAIRGTAIGSGGGGNSNALGANGTATSMFDQQGFVNPIIMMKNMGDYVMTLSSTILMGDFIMDGVLWAAKKIPVLGRVVEYVSGDGEEDEGKGSGTGETWAVIKTMAMVMIVVGAAMSIYIPLIPFITWMGAILAYAASMIEGLAGASLHAMAHLDGDGEGLGQRTTHGYMFYINAIARPALMIIGFFAASALMIAIGTLQAHMFLPAMANAQGNSLTGLASIIMFLLVFFVINLTLITASFNLIYVITDQVIGFIGGQVDSKLGRDTEDKVNNMFLMAARVGPSAIGQAGAAKAAARGAAARGVAGGGGDGPKVNKPS